MYLNGNLVGSSNTSLNDKPALNNIRVGSTWNYYPTFNFNGRIDEFRISNITRSAGWIMTEYNNQSTPGAFTGFSSTEGALPQIYNLTGSGSYCTGSAGLTVNLSGSQSGVDYQLRNNGTDVGFSIAGTGSPLSWPGLLEGVYTVIATRVATGTSANMNGSATIFQNPLPAAALGFAYQKPITLLSSRVSGGTDLRNFPVLINIPATPELEFVTNGGHVENSSGYDIIFTDANYNKLDHQLESYDPVTGNLLPG